MTCTAAVESGLVSCVALNEGNGQPITAKVRLQRLEDGWSLEITQAACDPSGDARLGLAAKRLVKLDAGLLRAIHRHGSVQCIIPAIPSRKDGPHSGAEQVAPLLLPRKVEDSLYGYQRQGVAWLLRHKRALLADDMGLGKTAQALAAARRLIRSGEVSWVLVVAPRSLLANWAWEARRWAPELTTATAISTGRGREESWQRLVRRAHLLLTSYEQLRDPAAALVRNSPDLIIADEAHRLRKIEALSTRGFRGLRVKRLWALTGTPIERDAEDIAVLMSLLEPTRFSPDDKSMHPTALRARLRPYLLRRRKEDVLDELPTVIESTETLDLTDNQRTAYKRAIKDHSLKSEEGFLPLFNRLRSICDIDENTGSSSKLDRIIELLTDIISFDEKAVVFSYILEPLRALKRRLGENSQNIGNALLTGEMSLSDRTAVLQSFKENIETKVLLASTRIASEGLTLTQANHVIFINRWWNPSANAQARDRLVRIGQSRIVYAKSFICRGTVEERLEEMLRDKKLTFNEIVGSLSQPSIRDSLFDLT